MYPCDTKGQDTSFFSYQYLRLMAEFWRVHVPHIFFIPPFLSYKVRDVFPVRGAEETDGKRKPL